MTPMQIANQSKEPFMPESPAARNAHYCCRACVQAEDGPTGTLTFCGDIDFRLAPSGDGGHCGAWGQEHAAVHHCRPDTPHAARCG